MLKMLWNELMCGNFLGVDIFVTWDNQLGLIVCTFDYYILLSDLSLVVGGMMVRFSAYTSLASDRNIRS